MQLRISKFKSTLYLLLVSFSISYTGLTQAAGGEYLDYGLHWVKMNNGQEQQVKAVERNGTVISRSSSYYSNAKPTVIYFHGWQNGSSEEGYRREILTKTQSRPGKIKAGTLQFSTGISLPMKAKSRMLKRKCGVRMDLRACAIV
jgi:predicted alpha/beta-fold hydrolase